MKYKLKSLLIISILLCSFSSVAQFIKMSDRVFIGGYVFEESTEQALPFVNIYDKENRRGTITDTSGYFFIIVNLNDTLVFSSLGYDKKYVVITDSSSDNDKPLIVFLDTKIYELNSVDIIALRKYQQLEYEITNMKLPDDDYVYAIRNFPFRPKDIDYYSRINNMGFGIAVSPITAIYERFSKEGKEKRKLMKVQADQEIDDAIKSKASIEFISSVLKISEQESWAFINWCKFTTEFVNSLTQYDFVNLVRHKFSQYKQLQQNSEYIPKK